MESRHISSAEMTAYWRSKYSKISKDFYSAKLASEEGIKKAHEFEEKFSYPLVCRKISVRAGWCLRQVTDILSTGKYDSCISLGSGLSLLTYSIGSDLINKKMKNSIRFIDVDLPNILRLRNERIAQLPIKELNLETMRNIEMVATDLEEAYKEGKRFKDLFPLCKAPVFIIEGIIYFLSKGCVDWIYQQISEYANSAVVFDYWPEGGLESSSCFKRVMESLDDFIPEKVRGLIGQKELIRLCRHNLIKDISLQEVEKEFSREVGEAPQLINIDDFIPVRLALAVYSSG